MCAYVVTHRRTHLHVTSVSPDPITNNPPPPVSKVTKWGPSYCLATREQWAPGRRNGVSKGQAILRGPRVGWRDGSQGGERRRLGVMGMVLGHIFNYVTKRVPAWETRQCFSNPTGHLPSTLHCSQLFPPFFFFSICGFWYADTLYIHTKYEGTRELKLEKYYIIISCVDIKHWEYLCYFTHANLALTRVKLKTKEEFLEWLLENGSKKASPPSFPC